MAVFPRGQKIRFPIFLVYLALLIITGLSPGAAAARLLIDQAGRQVNVPEDPRRVVALAPSITEIIFALGQEHRLQGVTQYSDFPPAALSLPRIGSYIHPDLERIVALQPDLCIGIKDGNPRHVVARLEELRIPVYVVNPRNLKGVMATILQIGDLLGVKDKAQELVAGMRGRIDRIQRLVAPAGRRPRVFAQIGVAPIVSVGDQTFINELITLAGGENLAAGAAAYPRFSREQVLALRPEVLIITSMTRGEAFDRVKAEWSRWPDLPAAAQQRIHLVDSNIFDRPSPRLVEGLEILFRLIHPELEARQQ